MGKVNSHCYMKNRRFSQQRGNKLGMMSDDELCVMHMGRVSTIGEVKVSDKKTTDSP